MIFYENFRFGNTEPCNYFTTENMTFGFHLHRCYEFIYVLEGSITVTINKDTYELYEKDAAIILSNHIHSYYTKGYSKAFVCIFSPELIKVFDNIVASKTAENPVITCFNEIQYVINGLEKTAKDDILNIKSYLYKLSAIIYENVTFIDHNKSDINLLHSLLQYIQDNFTQDISLKGIAASFNYDYHYLSRYFNHNVGASFKEFVNSYRINLCVEQLINTEMSVSEIALNSGFNDVRSFNRCFKNMVGIAPSDYRKHLFNKEN
jgi:AraC-like DNA-binding protein